MRSPPHEDLRARDSRKKKYQIQRQKYQKAKKAGTDQLCLRNCMKIVSVT